MYIKSTALYGGLTKKLGYITLKRENKEHFYSYGYDKEKSALLYSWMKNASVKHFRLYGSLKALSFLFDENQNKSRFSNMLTYLPSTLEGTDNKDMNPSLLNSKELRGEVTGVYYKIMKKIADISNQSLVGNSDAYIPNGGKVDQENEFLWIDDSYKLTKEKFQLSY